MITSYGVKQKDSKNIWKFFTNHCPFQEVVSSIIESWSKELGVKKLKEECICLGKPKEIKE